ncbi:MAG: DUF4198 domain-containing protein [Pseudomonadota bacterium]|nr:DUF4198 domain-containing protein [Pseudomonadota bacterium]
MLFGLKYIRLLKSCVLAALCATPCFAHEFWIEPQKFQVETGEAVIADFRNGQEFEGVSLGWFERRVARSETRLGEDVQDIVRRSGDRPAIEVSPSQNGLLRIIHETTLSSLTYQKPEKFQAFVDHKELDTSALPDPIYPIKEGYRRYAKSLVALGTGVGVDDYAGLEIEFVALKNPYVDDLSDGLPLQLFYQGSPRAGAQVEVFEKSPDGLVTITLLRTDPVGHVLVPVEPGHRYLIDSVVLRRPSAALAENLELDWESLWAALTFAVPN